MWLCFRQRENGKVVEVFRRQEASFFLTGNQDGASDHVGIVESCDGTTVHTIEGNSGDAVKQNSYTVNSQSILGYGLVTY